MRKMLILIVLVLFGCSHLIKEEPAKPSGITNSNDLLNEALLILKKDRDDFYLPRAPESYYRLTGRFPLIELIAADPFSVPEFGKTAANLLTETNSPSELMEISQQIMLVNTDNYKRFSLEEPVNDLNRILQILISAMNRSYQLQQEAIDNLTESEIAFLREDIRLYFYENGQMRFITGPTAKQYSILKLARKVDIKAILNSQLIMLEAFCSVRNKLQEVAAEFEPSSNQVIFEEVFQWGKMVVGGTGRNEYSENIALLIDLGGDDLYLNNAGGTVDITTPNALLVDISGNDRFQSKSCGSMGFGFLGSGNLIDLDGDDEYVSTDYSQGGGYIGCGILYDENGNDRYFAGKFTQGAGLFGLGILSDINGDDSYKSIEMTQGYGSTLGMGLLYDKSGDDRYIATSKNFGYAQGSGSGCRFYPWDIDFSMYGGIGFLLDDDGNDYYEATTFSQGSSYLLSMGMLIDRKGNDNYNGLGSYNHGGGVHLSSGFFLDMEGDDIYPGRWSGNGVGNDRSAGIFIDLCGNDRYYGDNGQGYSHKPFGFSLFIDADGDDVYDGNEYSQSYLLPPITPDNWGDVIFIDAGGNDSYSMDGRKNNTTWHLQEHAVGIDTQTCWESSFNINLSCKIKESEENYDPFDLFKMTDNLINNAEEDINSLLAKLGKGSYIERRSSEEALTVILLTDKPENENLKEIRNGLFSPDPESKAFTAMTIDLLQLNNAGDALLLQMDDQNAYVRKMLYRTIGKLQIEGGIEALSKALEKERNAICRGYAIQAIGRYKNPISKNILLRSLRDKYEFVRMSAAYALAKLESKDIIPHLKDALNDSSQYVRKAAGEALLHHNCRDGLKVMIEYLKFRALDTSSDNYGSNYGAVLMEYTNVNFGRDYDKWMEWFKENGETFKLKENLKARENYFKALKLKKKGNMDSTITAFEEALKANPNYLKAKADYASMLNNSAWNLVTSPENENDLTKGLKYANRCVELEPAANNIDTLAEALYQNGFFIEALERQKQALELNPENAEFKVRLEKITDSLK